MHEVFKKIKKHKIIAVLEIDSLEYITPLCETLLSSGINVIELALRT
jgi:2-keto-3-deoxy-6-phosphogluconate aldolase